MTEYDERKSEPKTKNKLVYNNDGKKEKIYLNHINLIYEKGRKNNCLCPFPDCKKAKTGAQHLETSTNNQPLFSSGDALNKHIKS